LKFFAKFENKLPQKDVKQASPERRKAKLEMKRKSGLRAAKGSGERLKYTGSEFKIYRR